jgi:putative transposase
LPKARRESAVQTGHRARAVQDGAAISAAEEWYVELLLLMPDHLHMLIAVSGEASLSKLIRDFKRIAARKQKIEWQWNFFDHRLRHDESETEKYDYICENPVRAGLVRSAEDWPFAFVPENPAGD